jgi:pantoate--beta-alanine ligase
VKLIVAPIVRESDGLALSSRNAFLSADERRAGLVLHRALAEVERLFRAGERKAEKLKAAALAIIAAEPAARLDYCEFVDPDTLEPRESTADGTLVAMAAWFGATRLIDNVILRA